MVCWIRYIDILSESSENLLLQFITIDFKVNRERLLIKISIRGHVFIISLPDFPDLLLLLSLPDFPFITTLCYEHFQIFKTNKNVL